MNRRQLFKLAPVAIAALAIPGFAIAAESNEYVVHADYIRKEYLNISYGVRYENRTTIDFARWIQMRMHEHLKIARAQGKIFHLIVKEDPYRKKTPWCPHSALYMAEKCTMQMVDGTTKVIKDRYNLLT